MKKYNNVENMKKYEGNMKKYEGNMKKYEGKMKKYEGKMKKYEGNMTKYIGRRTWKNSRLSSGGNLTRIQFLRWPLVPKGKAGLPPKKWRCRISSSQVFNN